MLQPFMYNEHCMTILANWKKSGVRNPHLLVGSQPRGGTGSESFIAELARGYHQANRLRAPLGRTFLALEYPDTHSRADLDRFFDSPRIFAEHANVFSGVFCVRLAPWGGAPGPDVEQLLAYAKDEEGTIQFIFSVNTAGDAELERIGAHIRQYVRLETVVLDYPAQSYYVDYAVKQAARQGIAIPAGAEPEFVCCVRALSDNNAFKGLDTIDRFVEELRYVQGVTDGHGQRENPISLAMAKVASAFAGAPSHKIGF